MQGSRWFKVWPWKWCRPELGFKKCCCRNFLLLLTNQLKFPSFVFMVTSGTTAWFCLNCPHFCLCLCHGQSGKWCDSDNHSSFSFALSA